MMRIGMRMMVCAGLVAGAAMQLLAAGRGSGDEASARQADTSSAKVLSADGLAVKSDIKVEYGEGHGETVEEALQDAMNDVLRKVVGVYVDSDFRMENDKIIKDEIITHSNGFIDRYKKMEVADDPNGRGKVVTIKAWVKIRDFVNRMKRITPSQTVKMDGAILGTDLANTVNAEAMLRKEFENLNPILDFTEVKLIDSIRPKVMKTTDDEVTLRYVFQVGYSKQKYFKSFIPRVVRVLDQIAEVTPEKQSAKLEVKAAKLFPRIDSKDIDSSWKEQPVKGECFRRYDIEPHLKWVPRSSVRFVTAVDSSGAIDFRTWKLTENLFGVYNELHKKCNDRSSKATCNISLIGSDDAVLARSSFRFSSSWCLIPNRSDNKIADFAPFFGAWSWVDTAVYSSGRDRWSNQYCKDYLYYRYVGCIDVTIDRKDLPKVKTAKITLESENSGENE